MIIFGTRGVTYSQGKGEFHCPDCGARRGYDHKRVRRFFTLYFIPLIPLDLLGEYVECAGCRSTYKPEVLGYDPAAGQAAFTAEYQHAVKQVMIALMLSDGRMDDAEVQSISEIYRDLTGSEITEAQIRSEASQTDPSPQGILARLQEMAPRLNDHGKEMVIRAAVIVAAADGDFRDEEQELVDSIGKALGMTSAHVAGVLHSMQNTP
jgi:tellurite resistance protein